MVNTANRIPQRDAPDAEPIRLFNPGRVVTDCRRLIIRRRERLA